MTDTRCRISAVIEMLSWGMCAATLQMRLQDFTGAADALKHIKAVPLIGNRKNKDTITLQQILTILQKTQKICGVLYNMRRYDIIKAMPIRDNINDPTAIRYVINFFNNIAIIWVLFYKTLTTRIIDNLNIVPIALFEQRIIAAPYFKPSSINIEK